MASPKIDRRCRLHLSEQAERNLLSTGVSEYRMTGEVLDAYLDTVLHVHRFATIDKLLHLLMPDLDMDAVNRGLHMLWHDMELMPERWLKKWMSGPDDIIGLLRYTAHLGQPVMLGDVVLDNHVPIVRKMIQDVGWSVQAWNDQHDTFVHLRYVR